jgi:hypothetical protein
MQLDVILKFLDFLVAAQIATKKEPEEEDKEDNKNKNTKIEGQPYIS